jgi:membrane complex biogenesis BtpA family protein
MTTTTLPSFIACIHLCPSLSYPAFPGRERALELLSADVSAALEGGADAILLENDNDRPHTLTVSTAQVAWITQAACMTRAMTRVPVGLGVQRIDWEATLGIAVAAGLDFVRLDVFVDEVRMLEQTVKVDASEVLALRRALGGESVRLYTDVHVKHAELVSGGSIEESARAAIACGSDVVVVTGAWTGQEPDVGELDRVRAAIRPAPVAIGSGLTPENGGMLARHADLAIVGTSLKDGDRVSTARVRRAVNAWRSARS